MRQQGSADPFSQSVNYMRSTTKWILLAYAAVGFLLIAGLLVSSPRQLEAVRLIVIIASAVFALLSVTVAIWFVTSIETVGHTTLEELVLREAQHATKWSDDIAFVHENRGLLVGYDSVTDLRNDFYAFLARRRQAAQREDTSPAEMEHMSSWVRYFNVDVVPILVSAVRYRRMRQQFERARWVLSIASVITALSLAAFAWALNPPPILSDDAVSVAPLLATVILSESQTSILEDRLGSLCVSEPVSVIVLNQTMGMADVVSVPGDYCRVARFTVNQNELRVP